MRWTIAFLLVLSACSTMHTVPVDRPVAVRTAVPVSCVASVPVRPAIVSDDALDKLSDYDLTLTIAQERSALLLYMAEASTVIEACRTMSP